MLHAENATYPWYPASVTKLMTIYVTLQAVKRGRITFDTLFTVSRNALAQSPTKMGYPVGTQVTVDNALKMMMVKSANDMAVLLAEGVDGSIENFADDMTRTAHRLGMTQSNFVNPNGLPADGQIISARDLAILARALIHDFPEYNFYWHIPAIKYGRRVVRNYNTLLGRYPGADGMKTGFICASGFNLVATATRNGKQLIAVVLGSPSGAARAVKAAELLESGFAPESAGVADAGARVGRRPRADQRRSAQSARPGLRFASQAAGRGGRGRRRQRREWHQRQHTIFGAAVEPARADPEGRGAPVRLRRDNADSGLYRADAHPGGGPACQPPRRATRLPTQEKGAAKTAAKPTDEKAESRRGESHRRESRRRESGRRQDQTGRSLDADVILGARGKSACRIGDKARRRKSRTKPSHRSSRPRPAQ